MNGGEWRRLVLRAIAQGLRIVHTDRKHEWLSRWFSPMTLSLTEISDTNSCCNLIVCQRFIQGGQIERWVIVSPTAITCALCNHNQHMITPLWGPHGYRTVLGVCIHEQTDIRVNTVWLTVTVRAETPSSHCGPAMVNSMPPCTSTSVFFSLLLARCVRLHNCSLVWSTSNESCYVLQIGVSANNKNC